MIAHQRHSNHCNHRRQAVCHAIALHAPCHEAHQHAAPESIEPEQHVADARSQPYKQGGQEGFPRQTAIDPRQARSHQHADGSIEEVAAQLQEVDPVAQAGVGRQQARHGHQRHGHPFVRDAEGPLQQEHQKSPEQAQQARSEQGVIKVLRQVGSHPRQQSARGHHALPEEQGRVQKQVLLLYAIQIVRLKHRQQHRHNRQHRKRKKDLRGTVAPCGSPARKNGTVAPCGSPARPVLRSRRKRKKPLSQCSIFIYQGSIIPPDCQAARPSWW